MAFDRAVIHRATGQLDVALRDINTSIDLKPDDPALYRFRSDVLGRLGQQERAVTEFAYALDLENYLKAKTKADQTEDSKIMGDNCAKSANAKALTTPVLVKLW